jgi:hypothetical protein
VLPSVDTLPSSCHRNDIEPAGLRIYARRMVMRHVVWLGLAALGAPAGGCLRDTQHACETAGACDDDGGDAGDDGGGGDDDARIDGAEVPLDAANGVIEHVPLAEETLGSTVLALAANRVIDTTALEFNGAAVPWLTTITSEQGDVVALARLDQLTIEINRTLVVTGSLPLVIIARRIDVNGTIDASANDANDGPGAILTGAAGGGDGVTGTGNVDGGGGGGGHGTDGAAGGKAGDAITGIAGLAAGDASLTALIGGGHGGRGSAGNCARALGGGGGGALQLYASEALTINGTLDVSGGGGRKNSACSAGGGGGGAGGALYLQSSTTITLSSGSRLASNGGGGGSGGGNLGPGTDGADGEPGMFAATGGNPVANGGGAGGAGGVLATPPVMGGDAGLNGGGGGGAVGRIVVHAPSVNAMLGSQSSPAYVPR